MLKIIRFFASSWTSYTVVSPVEFRQSSNVLRQPEMESRIEYRVQSRVQSTEHRAQSTEYSVQNTEYRVQSTEYRVQRTEYRVQSTEYRVQSKVYSAQDAAAVCGVATDHVVKEDAKTPDCEPVVDIPG